ncbi:hypothetical protein WDU94_008015 [Cyamophila willieti]
MKQMRNREIVPLEEKEIVHIVQACRKVFLSEPMLLELEPPLNICGDVHGQFDDTVRIFEYGLFPPQTNYLFLGDYVDRGKNSIETIVLLMAYKIKYPGNMYLLRGNHESPAINRVYGFLDECKRRYSVKLWKQFTACFNCMPVAALIEEKIFCCHGGLSPSMKSVDDVRHLPRPADVPEEGLMCDLLWSDPDPNVKGWGPNDRGVSFTFGEDVLNEFLETNNLDLGCRAHQVVEEGYEFFGGKRLVTIFSAPHYCGEFDNAGAMMIVDAQLMCTFRIMSGPDKGKTGKPISKSVN